MADPPSGVRRMSIRALQRLALVLMLPLVAASCERLDVGPEMAGKLGRARDDARAIARLGADSAGAHAESTFLVQLLYLERHQLGLGSPFRLIDYALTDPRLDSVSRRTVAWMLLARTLDGSGHQLEAAALEIAAARGQLSGAAGERHAALINRAVADARNPLAAESAVRVAYTIAAAEGTVSQWAPGIAARAAAVARDREMARDDARTLLRAARRQGTDPLALVPVWRAARRFQVERPPMAPLPVDAERESLELIPHLVSSLRITAELLVRATRDSLAEHARLLALNDSLSQSGELAPDDSSTAGPLRAPYRIAKPVAQRLVEIAAAAEMPPQTPVVVSMTAHRSRLFERRVLPGNSRRARMRFLNNAVNEETFAAEHALVRQDVSALTLAPALTALATAVAMRPLAQEEVWWPGMAAPGIRDLRDRFGLAAITFDASVPAEWHGYYTRMLSFGLTDMQRVMPSLKLRGLAIHVGESPMRSEALALHDPRARMIYLPVKTGAGTLAHEVAHDLDWQVARARYGTRGEYASDRAIRDRVPSAMATALQGLTSASLTPPLRQNNHRPPHDSRPAEVFARSVDWFVAVSLARDGRTNGYLSSVQDDVLTGYVTVAPPDITGEAGEALVRLLDDVAPVTTATRDWFLAHYGSTRSQGPHDLARKVLEHPVHTDGGESLLASQLAAVRKARAIALAGVDAEACRTRGEYDDRRLAAARTRVVMLAAEARARGLINAHFEVRLRESGERFAMEQALAGAAIPLVSFDPLSSGLVRGLLEQARMLEEVQMPLVSGPRPREGCAPVTTAARETSARR
jgi:hypothetical protein